MNHLKLQKELKLNSLQLLKLGFGQNIISHVWWKAEDFLMIIGYLWPLFISSSSSHTESLPHSRDPAFQ